MCHFADSSWPLPSRALPLELFGRARAGTGGALACALGPAEGTREGDEARGLPNTTSKPSLGVALFCAP